MKTYTKEEAMKALKFSEEKLSIMMKVMGIETIEYKHINLMKAKKYYTLRELSIILGVRYNTLRHHVARMKNKIPRVNREYRIYVDKLEQTKLDLGIGIEDVFKVSSLPEILECSTSKVRELRKVLGIKTETYLGVKHISKRSLNTLKHFILNPKRTKKVKDDQANEGLADEFIYQMRSALFCLNGNCIYPDYFESSGSDLIIEYLEGNNIIFKTHYSKPPQVDAPILSYKLNVNEFMNINNLRNRL